MWIRYEALCWLTGPYAEEYDASLQASYAPRDPVTEFLRGRISCRTLRVLGEGLPESSALVRARRGTLWTDGDYLLMHATNELRMMRAEAVAIAGGKHRKPDLIKPPEPPETPESVAEKAQQERRRREFEAGPMAALFPND